MTTENKVASSATAITPAPDRSTQIVDGALHFANSAQLMDFCRFVSTSDLVPRAHRGKPANCLLIWMRARDCGVNFLAALQNMMVVNERVCMFGDLPLALCMRGRDWDPAVFEETIVGEGDEMTARCTVGRRGAKPVTRTFSVRDAKRAKLWGKEGPWSLYPERMLRMRARGYALRDAFADVLAGISIGEEVADIEVEGSPRPQIECDHGAASGHPCRHTVIECTASAPPRITEPAPLRRSGSRRASAEDAPEGGTAEVRPPQPDVPASEPQTDETDAADAADAARELF